MFHRHASASELPPAWDELCAPRNPYLTRTYLTQLEASGLTRQNYHTVTDGDRYIACFTSYRRINNMLVFTGSRLPLPWPVTYVCLPVSIDLPGHVAPGAEAELAAAIRGIGGVKIVLNAAEGESLDGFVTGDYLPVVELENRWSCFEEYAGALRSGYRRRLRQSRARGRDVEFAFLEDNALFDEHMYSLYLDVFDRADLALEKLTIGYFRRSRSLIGVLRVGGRVEAFIQMAELGDRLRFEFGGFNRALNHKYDLYNNMLLEFTRHGIDNGFRVLDYGQTAYDCKLRFGGRMKRTYMLFSASNPVMHAITSRNAEHLDYPLPAHQFRVFKGDHDG